MLAPDILGEARGSADGGLEGIAHCPSVHPSAESSMFPRGGGWAFVLHTRAWCVFASLCPLSATGVQVALVLLSLLLSLLSFRVETFWRRIFPISLFKRGFSFPVWGQQSQLRPVVFAKFRGCLCCLSSHLLLPTLLGVIRERGRS